MNVSSIRRCRTRQVGSMACSSENVWISAARWSRVHERCGAAQCGMAAHAAYVQHVRRCTCSVQSVTGVMSAERVQEGSLSYLPPRVLTQLAQLSGAGSQAGSCAVQCEVQSVANRAAADVLALSQNSLKQPAVEELQVRSLRGCKVRAHACNGAWLGKVQRTLHLHTRRVSFTLRLCAAL